MKKTMLLLLVSFCTSGLFAQITDFHLSIRGGLNYSDMNYGYEFMAPVLAPDPTQGHASGGDSGIGYYIGIGSSVTLNPKLSLFLNTDYSNLNYLVEGKALFGSGPVSTDLERVIEINGNVNYSFVNIEMGIGYAFGSAAPNGLRTNVFLNHLIHLDTERELTLVYGDQGKGDESDLTIEDPDYNNLWLVGLGVAYQLQLSEQLSLMPSVDIRFGLNSIVEDEPAPSVIQFGLALNRKF